MKKLMRAEIMMFMACIFWGLSPSLTKIATYTLPTFLYVGIKFLIGSLLLMVIFRASIKHTSLKTILYSMVVSIFLFGAFTLETIGLHYTTPLKSSFYICTDFLFLPFISFILFKNKVATKEYFSLGLCFIGLLLVNFDGVSFNINLGDILSMSAALLYALQLTAVTIVVKKYEARNIAIFQLFFVSIFAFIFSLATENIHINPSSSSIFALIVSGLLCTGMAYFLQAVSQIKLPLTKAGIICTTIPFFGAIVSWILFKTTLNGFGFCGLILIIAAILNSNSNILRKKKLVNKANPV